MPIGKSSISRVAEGLDGANAAPMAELTPATEVEVKTVEATASAPVEKKQDEAPATAVEKAIVKKTAKKPAKKAEEKKPAAKKTVKKAAPAEEKKAPELIGQAVAAPAAKKRGRKPGTKNKPVAAPAPVAKKADGFGKVAIGDAMPVYLL